MEKQYPYGEGTVKWVSTQWLEEHLDDADLMILDVQPDVHDYIKEHIQGAVYANQGLLRVPLQGLPAQYAPSEAIQAILRRLGLKADVPVVVYTGTGPVTGKGDGEEQMIMAYALARFGHDNVYLLDGGIDKWKAEGRPLTHQLPQIEESEFVAQVRRDYFVEYETFKQMKDREDVIVLDARPSTVYAGQGPWSKAGHIPGAINIPWTSFVDPNNTRLLRPDEEIQAVVDQHGITPDKTIICSCGSGRHATQEFILLKWYLGFPRVKIYEGSFTEWTAYPENPTVTGTNPR